MWMVLIYEIVMIVEESLEKGEYDFEGIWFGVLLSFILIGFYSSVV